MEIVVDTAKMFELFGRDGERWTKDVRNEPDRLSLFDAVYRCVQVPADGALVEQVAERQGWGVCWHDGSRTTFDDVRSRIVSGLSVSGADLEDTFGPQWKQVADFVRRAAAISAAERTALNVAAQEVSELFCRDAQVDYALDAAYESGWHVPWLAARQAAWDAVKLSGVRFFEVDVQAVVNAAGALALRHVVGTHGFEQSHYDALTYPWRAAIGVLHSADGSCRLGKPVATAS